MTEHQTERRSRLDTKDGESTSLSDITTPHPALAPRRMKQSWINQGRPKGARNRATIVREVANEVLVVTEKGKRRRRRTIEVILTLLRNKALEGTGRAFDELHRLLRVLAPNQEGEQAGVILLEAPMSLEEWVERYGNYEPLKPSPEDLKALGIDLELPAGSS